MQIRCPHKSSQGNQDIIDFLVFHAFGGGEFLEGGSEALFQTFQALIMPYLHRRGHGRPVQK
jgi:hypothetical protein